MSIKKKVVFYFIAIFIIPVLLMSALEIGARLLAKGKHLVSGVHIKNKLFIEKDEDPDTFWRLRPYNNKNFPELSINSLGFKGREIVIKKPASEFRVACMGDSVTFGNEVTSFPIELEKLLYKCQSNKKK